MSETKLLPEMHRGFYPCKICEYTAPPELIVHEAKHFDSHAYECTRCHWRPEAMSNEQLAKAAYNTRAPCQPVQDKEQAIAALLREWERDRESINVRPDAKKDWIKRHSEALSILDQQAEQSSPATSDAASCSSTNASLNRQADPEGTPERGRGLAAEVVDLDEEIQAIYTAARDPTKNLFIRELADVDSVLKFLAAKYPSIFKSSAQRGE